MSKHEKIFVSDVDVESKKLIVYCLKSNDSVLYTVSNPSLKICPGISVDEDENMLYATRKAIKYF